ncbi:ABC transporter ATP-binding protein [Ruminiclostridium herbifermentans]|uniref:ABC transporter ATP-binding protein n=1 Tax=Ruminiclostridium herbifermentans TaxID=2488810 RepID=A0A4U7JEV1_9FIRM|nr:ABC transporter ATP-binding protein [Ruminiclostridium herbifermentans]QNU65656.1 ABC transporter ATP-binding protein [Ruminiclostridium herbifermentans]
MFKLVKYLKPYLKQVTLGPAFKLFEAILELLIPLMMAKLIDNGVRANNSSYIYMMGGLMVITAITGACSAYICQYYASIASQGFGTTMRNLLFKRVQSFSLNEIDKIGVPSLINRITSDVNQLQFAVAMLIRLVVRVPFLCIGGLIMAMLINLKLSLILLVIMPIFLVFIYIIMSRTVPLYKAVQKKLDTLSVIIRENLSGVRVIRAFARLDKERERFVKSNKEYAEASISVGRISALLNPVTTVVVNLGIAAILWFGGIEVYKGSMTQGEVIAYINYVNMILSALIVLANLVVTFTKAAASANRVNEILELEPSIVDKADFSESIINSDYDLETEKSIKNSSTKVKASNQLKSEEDEKPIIQFKNVSFSYSESSEYALKNISLEINKGQRVGIIGSTGAGKSTLVNLIIRFYDTTEGSVYVEGRNVKDYTQKELRDKIGLVPQKSVLFSGTIEDNLRWGNKEASQEEIEEAARIAQAYDFIVKKEEGFKSMISQGGANLSGGQKQRLAIARAIVKKPEILILDDSMSALDYATDAAFRKMLSEKLSDKTIIMVTQRVSTIKNADLIIVLDDGEIVGMGNNDYLLENCLVYQEIYNSQDEEKEAQNE